MSLYQNASLLCRFFIDRAIMVLSTKTNEWYLIFLFVFLVKTAYLLLLYQMLNSLLEQFFPFTEICG
ncbi:hypothetical protein DQ181_01670 [Enterococcus faecium]|nr:hypothetical protein [Enterococcus faecium]EGP5707855.1 hypothetical protein [Enterococcus faecium]ROX44855.1 hypothetical protein EGW26_10050 [Enterococcus faecium]